MAAVVESTPGEAFGNTCGTVEIEEAEADRVDGEEMGKDEEYIGKDAVVESTPGKAHTPFERLAQVVLVSVLGTVTNGANLGAEIVHVGFGVELCSMIGVMLIKVDGALGVLV